MIKAVCIDDTGRPAEFVPQSKWVCKGSLYHITHILFNPIMRVQSVLLAEIDLHDCSPYNSFRIDRFAIDPKDLGAFVELCKTSSLMADSDVDNLLKELQHVD